jgi:hypothetical protein
MELALQRENSQHVGEEKDKTAISVKEFVIQDIPEEVKDFYSRKKLSPLLGSQSFIEQIRMKLGNVNDKEELAEIKKLLISADLILDVIASKYQIKKALS